MRLQWQRMRALSILGIRPKSIKLILLLWASECSLMTVSYEPRAHHHSLNSGVLTAPACAQSMLRCEARSSYLSRGKEPEQWLFLLPSMHVSKVWGAVRAIDFATSASSRGNG